MDKYSVVHNTFVIERSYPVAVEKVFAAFADADKKRRWFAESGSHALETFEADVRVGGREKLQAKLNDAVPVVGGMTLRNETEYLDVEANRRIVFTSVMTLGGRRISASLGTVELVGTAKGTDLIFTHQGAFFEGSGGPEMRKDGWDKLLDKLGATL